MQNFNSTAPCARGFLLCSNDGSTTFLRKIGPVFSEFLKCFFRVRDRAKECVKLRVLVLNF
jgi:hypothetical protein